MADLPAVLSSKNGSIYTDLIFVAEAPGRFGAGRTGIPFHGDRSGNNFELLLNHAGLNRKDIFITNVKFSWIPTGTGTGMKTGFWPRLVAEADD